MNFNKRFSLMLLVAALVLAACSSLNLPGAADSAVSADGTPAAVNNGTPVPNGRPGDFASQPIESKLAMGTLQLEGTDQAVTAAQAAELLPLWKAVKALSASDTASADEISALYNQIQETMTPEQLAAIEAFKLSQEDLSALMTQYGIEAQADPMANLSEDERATRMAEFQARIAQGGQGGRNGQAGGGAGGPPNGGAMEMPQGGGAGPFGGQPNAQGTAQPGRGMRGGMNTLWVDPLIKLLTERAAA